MSRALDNFRFWRSLVGLPDAFPRLEPPEDAHIKELMVIEEGVKEEILNSLWSGPLSAVTARNGCGLTTLYQYILHVCQEAPAQSQRIPIAMDLADEAWQKNITPKRLEEEIKFQVIGNLVTKPWLQVLDRAHYFYCLNYTEDKDFYTHQAEMRSFLFERRPTQAAFHKAFPFARLSLADFLNYLLEKMRIQTSLLVHYPRELPEQVILDWVTALKLSQEGGTLLPAAFREMHFLTPQLLQQIYKPFTRHYHHIEHPGYTPAQIMNMLIKRYKPSQAGPKGTRDYTGLGSVFSERFVRLAWQEGKSIQELLEEVRTLVLERLDCKKKEVPFRLTPTPDQMKAHESKQSSTKDTPKFIRRRGA